MRGHIERCRREVLDVCFCRQLSFTSKYRIPSLQRGVGSTPLYLRPSSVAPTKRCRFRRNERLIAETYPTNQATVTASISIYLLKYLLEGTLTLQSLRQLQETLLQRQRARRWRCHCLFLSFDQSRRAIL